MQNYIRDGMTISATATAARSSGDGQLIGSNLVGIAANDIANSAVGEFHVHGVFELPKPSADNFTVGLLVNWDDTAGEFQIAAGDLASAGMVWEASGPGNTTARVKINPPQTA